MTRRLVLLVLTFLPVLAVAEPGFQSITVLFGESWTGNAYVPPDYNVTGSETGALDPAFGGGVRFNLVDPFLFGSGALTIEPRLILSARRYLLYPSLQVVPTQRETALGAEDLVPGLGSARIMTFRIEAPVGLQIGMGERAALSVALSPSLVFRLRAGDAEYATAISDLNPMYAFFYGHLRWFRPDGQISFRYDVSENLSFTVRSSTSLSIWDMVDSTLPWWDQFQTGVSLELDLVPPLSGLFRTPEGNREITLPEVSN